MCKGISGSFISASLLVIDHTAQRKSVHLFFMSQTGQRSPFTSLLYNELIIKTIGTLTMKGSQGNMSVLFLLDFQTVQIYGIRLFSTKSSTKSTKTNLVLPFILIFLLKLIVQFLISLSPIQQMPTPNMKRSIHLLRNVLRATL